MLNFQNRSKKETYLNPEFSFETFIPTSNSSKALSLAKKMANPSSEDNCNIMIIYGPQGMGKTHLMSAIGLQLRNHSSAKRVECISAEALFNRRLSFERKKGNYFYHNYYDSTDVLLIDDIQILARPRYKDNVLWNEFKTELLQLLYFFLRSNKLMVFTCELKLNSFKNDRLLNEIFNNSSTVEITEPDAQTKRDLLKILLNRREISLPESMIDYILKISKSENIRSLVAAATLIEIAKNYNNNIVDLAFVQNHFEN